jgi:hypothetical protein
MRGLLFFMLLAGTAGLVAQTAPPVMQRPVPRDAVNEAALRQQMAGARKLGELLQERKLEAVDPERRPQASTRLQDRSIILSDGDTHTFLPPGSILHLPAALRERVAAKPAGEFLLWPAFLERHASWLTAQEVPLAMARGDARAAAGVLAPLATEKKLVVAVYRQGPISILEAAPPAAKAGN